MGIPIDAGNLPGHLYRASTGPDVCVPVAAACGFSRGLRGGAARGRCGPCAVWACLSPRAVVVVMAELVVTGLPWSRHRNRLLEILLFFFSGLGSRLDKVAVPGESTAARVRTPGLLACLLVFLFLVGRWSLVTRCTFILTPLTCQPFGLCRLISRHFSWRLIQRRHDDQHACRGSAIAAACTLTCRHCDCVTNHWMCRHFGACFVTPGQKGKGTTSSTTRTTEATRTHASTHTRTRKYTSDRMLLAWLADGTSMRAARPLVSEPVAWRGATRRYQPTSPVQSSSPLCRQGGDRTARLPSAPVNGVWSVEQRGGAVTLARLLARSPACHAMPCSTRGHAVHACLLTRRTLAAPTHVRTPCSTR